MKPGRINKILAQCCNFRHIEYLAINQEFEIIETSEGVQKFADSFQEPILGKDVRDAFPELIGVEDILREIIRGTQEIFDYKGIARLKKNQAPLYIDIYVVKDEAQENNRLLVFLENVTEKMVLEQTLIQRNNELELLLTRLSAANKYIDKIIGSMADALLVTNQAGNIKTLNKASQELFEYGESELINQHISTIIDDSYEETFKLIQKQLLSPGESLADLELLCHTKTGKKVLIAFSCSAIETEIEGIENFIYIGRDITQRHLLECERQRVEKRLLAQYAISKILSDSVTLKQALAKILLAICGSLGWDIGEFWMPELGENFQLKCVEIWSRSSLGISESIERSKQTFVSLNNGLPDTIWRTGSPLWIADLVNDSNFVRSQLAVDVGLQTSFGFPVLNDKEALGVMIFFSRQQQELDEELLQIMLAIGSQIGQFIQRKRAETALQLEQEQTERLLLNILPQPIAKRLKDREHSIADYFAEVTVMFADIVGFTELSSRVSPTEVVEILNDIFSEFDRLAETHNLEKIKTIGDAYMVVAGLPKPQSNHAIMIAEMALDMQAAIALFNQETGNSLSMRIGINTGDVVAGVIGTKKFTYDLWGDTVNIASRMESHGLPGKIQVTETTYQCLRDRYLFEQRGCIPIKGKGEMLTYFLTGRRG